jgi:hypothetical protein
MLPEQNNSNPFEIRVPLTIKSILLFIKKMPAKEIATKSPEEIWNDYLHRDTSGEKRCSNCRFKKGHVCKSKDFMNLSLEEMEEEYYFELPYCKFFEFKNKL